MEVALDKVIYIYKYTPFYGPFLDFKNFSITGK